MVFEDTIPNQPYSHDHTTHKTVADEIANPVVFGTDYIPFVSATGVGAVWYDASGNVTSTVYNSTYGNDPSMYVGEYLNPFGNTLNHTQTWADGLNGSDPSWSQIPDLSQPAITTHI